MLKRGNPSIKEMVEDVFRTDNYQLLIENKTFVEIEIRKTGNEFKNKLEKIDIDDIIDSIPNQIKKVIVNMILTY
ncbi:hypothetical protein ABFV69_06950 [Staphylococcus saprophyticus]